LKEPIEAVVSVSIFILILSSITTLISSAPKPPSIAYIPLDSEVSVLMDKLVNFEGLPRDWDVRVLRGGAIMDFGIGGYGGVDRDKVNLLTYNLIGKPSNLNSVPFRPSPYGLNGWVDGVDRGFSINFTPILNITITCKAVGGSYNIEVKVYTLDGSDVTSDSDLTIISAYVSPVGVKFSYSKKSPLQFSLPVKAIVAIANYNGLYSLSYWVDGETYFGFTVGCYIISPLSLSGSSLKMIFQKYIGEDFMTDVKFNYTSTVGGLYIYRVYNDGWSVVDYNLDPDAVLFAAVDSSGLRAVFTTYPAPIYTQAGLLSTPNLSFGGVVPAGAASSSRVVSMGFLNYIVKLYVWGGGG
jgi:hypothetical protein